jgi:acetyl esterase/lipase
MRVAILLRSYYSLEEQNTYNEQFEKWFKELSMTFKVFEITDVAEEFPKLKTQIVDFDAIIVHCNSGKKILSSLQEAQNLKKIVAVSEEAFDVLALNSFRDRFPAIDIIHGRGVKSFRWAARKIYYESRNKFLTLKYGLHRDQVAQLAGDLDYNQRRPVVVLIHGGFWRFPYEYDMNYRMLDYLVRQDLLVWNVEYRRLTSNSYYVHSQTESDILEAVTYLKQVAGFLPIDLERVLIVGHSAGGYLALRCGHQLVQKGEKVAGLISLSGVVDLLKAHSMNLGNGIVSEYFQGKTDKDFLTEINMGLEQDKIPIWLVHGDLDTTVPEALSKAYVKRMAEKNTRVRYSEIPGADHMDLTKSHFPFWNEIVEAAKNPRYLKEQEEKNETTSNVSNQ